MKVWSDSFKDGAAMPGDLAFCVIDTANPANHIAMSSNRNPHLAWSDLPAGTQSLAVICHDVDVPSKPDDVNQEGRTIPASLPRVDFYHWILLDLPANAAPIAAGEFSNAITPRGKPGPAAPRGTRQGINDYSAWFAGDANMSGDYYGYDGPCPPWNDTIVHHYTFTVYALSVVKLDTAGLHGAEVLAAMQGKILGKASITGLYSLNPAVKA